MKRIFLLSICLAPFFACAQNIEFDKAIEQILLIAELGKSGEIYNVGSGTPKKMRAILQGMVEKEGIPWSSVVESNSEAIGRKGFDVPVIYADISKVLKLKKLNN